jgi:hypothetical protein
VELVFNAAPASERPTAASKPSSTAPAPSSCSRAPTAFEARFALYSDGLRAGDNELVLRLTGDIRPAGLSIPCAPACASPQRPVHGYAALDQIEQALRADFAAPRRVHIDAAAAGR